MKLISLVMMSLLLVGCGASEEPTIRVATFNVSMESDNYRDISEKPGVHVLQKVLASGEHPQVKNIAEIIQRVDPDILLLNEFDYIADANVGVKQFIKAYLNKSQGGQTPVDYPYIYISAVNTGEPTPFDLDNNGKNETFGNDAYGYGLYPGQYGMALLSKYPIDVQNIRTLTQFKWRDMPEALDTIDPETGLPWYNDKEWADMRLSSKSHWDIPINVNGKWVHVLAMHPTPPTFDGPEDRNGNRNHDEIRLMADYLTPDKGLYIYDDNGEQAGLQGQTRFVLVGDYNAADIGDKHRPGVIEQLTNSPLVNNTQIPVSVGGAEAFDEDYSRRYTAYWGARADYVLPSTYGFTVQKSGVFWPAKSDELYRLVKDRKASSDHRLVWVDLQITQAD
jgi:hypothetical protein